MIYFDADYLTFFSGLETNNTKEWFDANKKTYENKVKKPFTAFIEELIAAYNSLGYNIPMTAKDAVMRINRDVRFSNDKSPYKMHMSAMISPNGKKDTTQPGMYIEVNHKHVRVYTGSHMLEKQDLYNVREHIANNVAEFTKLITNKAFKDVFGEIRGEKNKVLPPEFKEAAEKQPLIYNKSFYYFANFDPKVLTQESLVDKLIAAFKVAMPVNAFFEEALNRD